MEQTALEVIIKDKIRREGPIGVDTYMELCLYHPEHGYYMTRDPFGAGGDFTTAPEISQLFGEMIGVWLADMWIKMGRPDDVALIECGPGRGTLMADIMRATKNVAGFHEAAQIYLMEISPVLRAMQAEKLAAYRPQWIGRVDQIPETSRVLIVGNEFFDALPIRQLVKRGYEWGERKVALDKDDRFVFVEEKILDDILGLLPDAIRNNEAEGIIEVCLSLNQFMKSMSFLLKKQKGAVLFCDYGYAKTAFVDSLQAIFQHKKASIFDTPGLCDLTTHVNFDTVLSCARSSCIETYGPVSQHDFLIDMGIETRAQMLSASVSSIQCESISDGMSRLIDTAQMGTLFKVVALCDDPSIQPAGFYGRLQG